MVNAPDLAVGWGEFRVSIELKSGPVRGEHLADVMFGALVEAMRFGRVPDRVVLWSLASGEGVGYDVRADDLRAAARRVIATVKKIDALDSRPPMLAPGGHCRFCPTNETCPEAAITQGVSSVS